MTQAAVFWLTGLPSAGKSTIGRHLGEKLNFLGHRVVLLDGDILRGGLCQDLGYSEKDRNENIRRAGEIAKLFFEHGSTVICTFISPLRAQREKVRGLFPKGRFFEIFIRCGIETCIQRDPKGLYKKALDGTLPEFTGISSPYEEPLRPEIVVDTEKKGIMDAVKSIIAMINGK